MIAILKIVHLLALSVGLGGGVATLIVRWTAAKADPALGGRIALRISRAGFLAVLVLWATGIALATRAEADGLTLGLFFWLKIAAAVVLTGAMLTLQVRALRPGPEVAALARLLSPLMLGASTLAVVFAVLAFG
ncbi:hypothetical protein R5H32_13700 [Defluviimonas sp. D31]|uniref:hypothetical protein n=1 Tax=Defluviimonas sp. D31 TaxID=3083253 RepID=UPI00296E86E3|nr:hypothetical protein [Defluviimonas sp. D31]MDW4550411.1 hypothetical protein [Defluviimonas sp. D31]